MSHFVGQRLSLTVSGYSGLVLCHPPEGHSPGKEHRRVSVALVVTFETRRSTTPARVVNFSGSTSSEKEKAFASEQRACLLHCSRLPYHGGARRRSLSVRWVWGTMPMSPYFFSPPSARPGWLSNVKTNLFDPFLTRSLTFLFVRYLHFMITCVEASKQLPGKNPVN